MTNLSDGELGETRTRFLSHWIASCFGFILNRLLPLVLEWPAPAPDEAFPRWWMLLGSAGLVSIATGGFNANLPVTARELMKSATMGFAICASLKIFGVIG